MSSELSGPIIGILLAAGHGSRFDPSGQQLKLLAPLAAPPGHHCAELSSKALLAACDAALAVVAANACAQHATLREHLSAAGCELALNADVARGMGHSIALGVRAAAWRWPDASGCLIALADMPWITADTMRRVALALRQGHPTVAPSWNGRQGHPVGFSSALFPSLMQLDGDEGARHLLAQHPPHWVAVQDCGISSDVDTLDDVSLDQPP